LNGLPHPQDSTLIQMAFGLRFRRTARSLRRRLAGLSGARVRLFGKTVHRTRRVVAAAFVHGDGIEIGALHRPLIVPRRARVKYVDRMTATELREHYPELVTEPLVRTDIIDDGETLVRIADATQDFVIANHFIEHCENPLLTFQNLFRVLKPAGILFIAVPDKRFTFDVDRPSTTFDHVLRDFSEGPAWSRRQHYEEWSRLVNKRRGPEIDEEVEKHLKTSYSIHFHVWSAPELYEFVAALQQSVRFELEVFLRNGSETIIVLRKG
jgi:SAM-dependent methyltransferase